MRSAVAATIGVAAGVWIMAAPAVLGYAGSAATSDRIVGPTAAAIAWVARSEATRSLRWGNVAFGLWATIAPALLDHSAAAAAHSVTSGIILILSALATGGIPSQRYAGGWKALLQTGEDHRDTEL